MYCYRKNFRKDEITRISQILRRYAKITGKGPTAKSKPHRDIIENSCTVKFNPRKNSQMPKETHTIHAFYNHSFYFKRGIFRGKKLSRVSRVLVERLFRKRLLTRDAKISRSSYAKVSFRKFLLLKYKNTREENYPKF